MKEAEIERGLQAVAAANFAGVIEAMQKNPPSPYFLRAYLNGVLSATAAHLTREFGPQEAYSTFQRVADACAAEFLET